MSYTFTQQANGPSTPDSIATSANGTIVLTSSATKVYVSRDSGVTWPTEVYLGFDFLGQATMTSTGTKMALLIIGPFIYISLDSGFNWNYKSVPIDCFSIQYTRDGTKLIVGGSANIYESENNGDSWTQIASGLPSTIHSLSITDDGNKILASLDGTNGVYIGINSGGWSWIQYLDTLQALNSSAISADGTILAVAIQSDTIRYSTDGGLTWLAPSGAFGSISSTGLVMATNGSRITTYGTDGFVYTSTNFAGLWTGSAMSYNFKNLAGSSTLSFIVIGITGSRVVTGILDAGPVICFRDGSKILTFNPATGREEYTAVENIRPGTLVKTRMSGYVPVCMVGTSTVTIPNSAERTADRLYVCSKDQFPELTEDLYITGHHSILTNAITDAEREECAEEMGRVYLTEGRCRLPAHISRRTRVYEAPGAVERIWHFALDHNDEQMNYGVYANGLLVESCSIWRLRTMVGYTIMDSRSQVYMVGDEESVRQRINTVVPIVC